MSYVKKILSNQIFSQGKFPDLTPEAKKHFLTCELRHYLWEFNGVALEHYLRMEVMQGEAVQGIPKFTIIAKDRNGDIFGPVAEFLVFTDQVLHHQHSTDHPTFAVRMYFLGSETKTIQYLNKSTLSELFEKFAQEFPKTGLRIWDGVSDPGASMTKFS